MHPERITGTTMIHYIDQDIKNVGHATQHMDINIISIDKCMIRNEDTTNIIGQSMQHEHTYIQRSEQTAHRLCNESSNMFEDIIVVFMCVCVFSMLDK